MSAATSPKEINLGGEGAPPPLATSLSPGAALAQARQKLGLSVGDIAAKLRMSVAQIDAMERGEYSKLPTGTFLRGFVRSYAKLVALEPEPVLKLLEDTHADGRRPTIVVPTQNIKMSTPGEKYSSPRIRSLLSMVLLLAITAGGAYWWLEVRPGQAERLGRAPAKAVSEPVAVVPAAATTPAIEPAPSAEASSARPTQPNTPLPSAVVAAPDSPSIGAPQVPPLTQTTAPLAPARTTESTEPVKTAVPKGSGSLRFSFSAESWVEVVDASGRTIVSRRFSAGQEEIVVGKLPLSVVIGNATVTKLKFNEVDFDLTPHTRVAVARFTLK